MRTGTVEENSTTLTDPFVPARFRVVEHHAETSDIVTLALEPIDGAIPTPRPGQFNMLTAFGVGEAAISISGAPSETDRLLHTIRAVGPVSTALTECAVGDIVGVRGPFGTDWAVENVGTRDVVIVAGGIGLAPLRSVVVSLLERARAGVGRLYVLIGARSPDDIVFLDELPNWRAAGAHVAVTVDAADRSWRGRVGLVTTLIPDAKFDPEQSVAMLCGPEIMMRFSVRALLAHGIDAARVHISLERNMQCGVGLCGHCQLGPLLLCRDGPIVPFTGVVPELLSRREL